MVKVFEYVLDSDISLTLNKKKLEVETSTNILNAIQKLNDEN